MSKTPRIGAAIGRMNCLTEQLHERRFDMVVVSQEGLCGLVSCARKIESELLECAEARLASAAKLSDITDALVASNKKLATAEAIIEQQKKTFAAALENATELSKSELRIAEKLRRESSPEALESERAANAMLTEELEKARAKIDSYAEALKIANEGRGTLREAVKTLTAINDALQTERSGMRAEVEQLKQEIRDNNAMAVRQIVPAETLVDDLTAEIEQLKTIANTCAKTEPNSVEWCEACISRKWCERGTLLVEAAEKQNTETTWNYRIIRTLEAMLGGKVVEWLQIHRVYYTGNKITSWEKEPVKAGGESVGELQNDLRHLMDACKRPVLNAEDMPQ